MGDGRLAVVTGASTGIGLELARLCARDGASVVMVADEPAIESAADGLRNGGGAIEAMQADLATEHGLDALWSHLAGRRIDWLMANAGLGLGHAFLDQDWKAMQRVIDTNVTGTTSLLHRAVPEMRAHGEGRILVTGSIAGLLPGSYQAVYNATKAYLDNLALALRHELQDSGVTVTCLMPGPTETEFFARAGMQDTPVGQGDKSDPAEVAEQGYRAMLKGSSGVTPGFMNKVQTALAGVLPETVLARMHREMAEPEGDAGGRT